MADNGIDWGQLGKGLIGQSDRQVLDRETDRFTGPKTSVRRTGVEKIMDTIFRGGSSEGLQNLSKDDYVRKLKETYGSKLELLDDDVRRDLGIVDRQGINSTMSEADVARQIKTGRRLEEARRTGRATRGIAPEVLQSTDPEVIQRGIENAQVETKRKDTESDPIYQNTLKQQNLTNQMALSQMALSEQRASNQMQIAMMDNQLERRRMDMKESRLDRKDRQAMIQQMMAGLSTLGASIAI
jgi:hypothetical protein